MYITYIYIFIYGETKGSTSGVLHQTRLPKPSQLLCSPLPATMSPEVEKLRQTSPLLETEQSAQRQLPATRVVPDGI